MTTTMKMSLAVLAFALFAVPVAFASASVDFNTTGSGVTFNGKAGLTGINAVEPGDNIRINVEFTVTSDDDVNTLCADWQDDGLSRKCVSFNEITQTGTYTRTINVPAPDSQGEQDIVFTLFGDNDLGEQDFNGQADNLQDTYTINNRVAVDEDGTSGDGIDEDDNDGSGSSVSQWDAVMAALTAIVNKLNGGGSTPAPAGSSCAQLSAKMTGTQMNVYNNPNVALQGFLLSDNPNSIPALKAGSTVPMGYYGPQTAAAISMFKSAHQCL